MRFATNVKYKGNILEAGSEVPKDMDKETVAELKANGAIATEAKRPTAKVEAPETDETDEVKGNQTGDQGSDEKKLPVSMENTKTEVVEYAKSIGATVDESKTKREILDSLMKQ